MGYDISILFPAAATSSSSLSIKNQNNVRPYYNTSLYFIAFHQDYSRGNGNVQEQVDGAMPNSYSHHSLVHSPFGA
jgi:hypothetical protein